VVRGWSLLLIALAGCGAPPPSPPAGRGPVAAPLASLCGIATGGIPLGSDAASTAARSAYLDTLVQLGATRLRRDFTWSTIEPARGQWAWDDYDRLVDDAGARSIKLLGILDYGTTWAAAGATDDKFPPDDPADFAAYASATAARYQGRVDAWEVWNEPNFGLSFWHPTRDGDPAAYGKLLDAAADGVHGGDASAPVAFAGTVFTPQISGSGLDFDRAALDAAPQARAKLQDFAIHAYERYAPATAPEYSDDHGELDLASKIGATDKLLSDEGIDALPIWITEIGWPTTLAVNEDAQARWMVRATLIAAQAGAATIYWYTLFDGPNPTMTPPEDAFGLVHYDPMPGQDSPPPPKASFRALQALLALGGALEVQRSTDLVTLSGAGAHAIELRGGSTRLVALWDDEQSGAPSSATVVGCGGAAPDQLDRFGAPLAAAAGPLALAPDPIYLRFNCP
jgi:hypothetical protein